MSTSSKEGSTLAFAWGKAFKRTWWLCHSAARSSLQSSASPDYFKRHAVPRHPSDLVHHNCVRFRFSGSGAIYKWEFQVNGRLVEYELGGNLTISDSLFSVEAALEGIGLAYTFEQLALPHIKTKKLKRVLSSFSPTFPGFYLYYPSRRQQPSKMKALVDYARAGSINRRAG